MRMLELLCQVLLQGLLVAYQAAAALEDCCPVKEVQGFSQDVCLIFSIENLFVGQNPYAIIRE